MLTALVIFKVTAQQRIREQLATRLKMMLIAGLLPVAIRDIVNALAGSNGQLSTYG
jgi:hypothetical protein